MVEKKRSTIREDIKAIALLRIKAFTLVEVLAVLALLGILFTTLFFLFKELYTSSLRQKTAALELDQEAKLFWRLTRAFYGAKKFVLRKGTELYFITTGANIYRGLVKEVYKFQNGTLYYCEFPYPYGTIYECNSTYPLFRFRKFKAVALNSPTEKGEENTFKIPPLLKVEVNNDTFYLKNF